MSGRLHTKTATLTLLRDFQSAPSRLSEWVARGFRTAPTPDSQHNAPDSLSDSLKRLRQLLEKSPSAKPVSHKDDHYQQLIHEIHCAGEVSPRELPKLLDHGINRPLTQEHIHKHLLTDSESLERLRKAIRNINTADQNHCAHQSSRELFSEQTAKLVQSGLFGEEEPNNSQDIALSLLR